MAKSTVKHIGKVQSPYDYIPKLYEAGFIPDAVEGFGQTASDASTPLVDNVKIGNYQSGFKGEGLVGMALNTGIGLAESFYNQNNTPGNAPVADYAMKGLSIGATIGGTVGSVIPGLGTAVGGVLGAGIGAVAGTGYGVMTSEKHAKEERNYYQARDKNANEQGIFNNQVMNPDLVSTKLAAYGGPLTKSFKKYPGLSKVYGENGENVTVKADTNFNPRDIGYGDIEFFQKGQDSVRYSDNKKYRYANPSPNQGYGILYNPKKDITEQDMFLDLLHGMKGDSNYAKLRENFKQQTIKDRAGDIKYFYNKDKKAGFTEEEDGYNKWVNNYVDGLVRSEFFEGKDNDYTIEKQGNTPAMKQHAAKMKEYLQQKAYGGRLPELGEGGSIHIKPENRGKFTAYKKRTGKTTEEALHSSNAHVRKMANFAKNAAKWHHAYGGMLPAFSAGGDIPQVVRYDTGGSHTTNPNGGIPVDSKGNPSITSGQEAVALTKQGEVTWQGFVFSDNLTSKGRTGGII
jgi:hypothetical protein